MVLAVGFALLSTWMMTTVDPLANSTSPLPVTKALSPIHTEGGRGPLRRDELAGIGGGGGACSRESHWIGTNSRTIDSGVPARPGEFSGRAQISVVRNR
jgi:hypothetical protein